MGLWVVSRTRFDVARLKRVLDSNLSKSLMKKVLTTKTNNGKYLFEELLDAYADNSIPPAWKIRYYPVFKLLDVIRRSFNRDHETFRKELKHPTIRKIFRNAIRSLEKYGLGTPQAFADPLMIVWNFTNQCNLRCKHCYQDAGVLRGKPQVRELTTEEKFKVVDIIAERDIPSLFFSGGEPLIRPEFFDVAAYAKEKGIYLSIATNGTLITREVARKIADIGFGYVQVSIDAASPEKHDSFRGVPGMWERSIQGIKNLIDAGVITCIAYTHMRWNHKEFPGILKLRKELGAYKVIVYNFIPVGRGDMENDPTPEEREELWKWMYDELDAGHHVVATTSPAFGAYCKMHNAPSIVLAHYADLKVKELGVIADVIGGCGAGRCYFTIQPDGTVTPCVYMPDLSIGNILEDSFDYLWDEHPAMQQLKRREETECDCPYLAVCGGCRARALVYTGNLMGPDPECMFNRDLYYELREKKEEFAWKS